MIKTRKAAFGVYLKEHQLCVQQVMVYLENKELVPECYSTNCYNHRKTVIPPEVNLVKVVKVINGHWMHVFCMLCMEMVKK